MGIEEIAAARVIQPESDDKKKIDGSPPMSRDNGL